MQITLGNKAKDAITGFEGTITAIAEYLGGSTRVQLSNLDKDGKPLDWWFDEERLEEV